MVDISQFLVGMISSGSPRPDVVWLHNGKEIPNSEDFAYENDNGTYRLLIAEIFPEDTGLYTCEASNAAGDATSSCTVKVIGQSHIHVFSLFLLKMFDVHELIQTIHICVCTMCYLML